MSAHLPLTKLEMDDPEAWILQERRKVLLPKAWRKILQGLDQRALTPLSVRCAEIALDHLDPAPKWSPAPLSPPVINVLIVNSEAAGLAAQTNGGAIRVVSSEGNGAGDSVPGRPGRRQDVGGVVGDGDARD